MPIFCALPNSITLPTFMYWCISVSEFREFNRKKKKKKKKKKMNNLKNGFFKFYTIPVIEMDSFFDQTYFLMPWSQ